MPQQITIRTDNAFQVPPKWELVQDEEGSSLGLRDGYLKTVEKENRRNRRLTVLGTGLSTIALTLSSWNIWYQGVKKAESELRRANIIASEFDQNGDKNFSDDELLKLVETFDKRNSLHKLKELIDNIPKSELGKRLSNVLAEYELMKGFHGKTEELKLANDLIEQLDAEEPKGQISESEVRAHVNRVVGADGEVFFSDPEIETLKSNAALLREHGFHKVAGQIIDLIPAKTSK